MILIILLLVWFINLELSLGGIWLRVNEKGDIVFTLRNIISIIKAPLKYSYFWSHLLDINIYSFMFFGLSYSYLIKEFLNHFLQ